MSELWVLKRMDNQKYMEILQQIEVEVECQMVAEILVEQATVKLSVEENVEFGEVMILVGLVDGIWSEVILSDEKKYW